MKNVVKQWWLSLVFLAGYPLVFHLWVWLPSPVIIVGITAIVVISGISSIAVAWRGRYFTSNTEVFMYVCVVVDILVEATLIVHPKWGTLLTGLDFWWCTLAFAIVMGGYRWWRLKSLTQNT